MLLVLILLIFTVAICYCWSLDRHLSFTLMRLRLMGDHLCAEAGFKVPQYDLHLDKLQTYTSFSDGRIPSIRIVLCKDGGNLYNDRTLRTVFIHELAHILSPAPGHGENFERIENDLLKAARDLNFINNSESYDLDYPCYH